MYYLVVLRCFPTQQKQPTISFFNEGMSDKKNLMSDTVATVLAQICKDIAELKEKIQFLEKQNKFLKTNQSNISEFKEDSVVTLLVGGIEYVTTLTTLRTVPKLSQKELEEIDIREDEGEPSDNYNMLASIASGKFTLMDHKGRIVIDRDGSLFFHILNYLREHGDVKRACIPLEDKNIIEKLSVECDFYSLKRMKHLILNWGEIRPKWLRDREWAIVRNISHQTTEGPLKIGLRLYKASKDGYSASKFHSLCDNKGPTLSIVKSRDGNIFGGYNSKSWEIKSSPFGYGHTESTTNWLFCFPNSILRSPTRFPLATCITEYKAAYNDASCLMVFGDKPYDLCIVDNCNTTICSTKIGGKYKNSTRNDGVLNGGKNLFLVEEIEVYQIVSK